MPRIFGRRPFLLPVLVALLAIMAFASPLRARAVVDAHIDLSTQRMTVYVNGSYYATWRVSTARRGYYTPRGTFRPRLLKRMHYSRKYHNSPMPHSVFFLGGFAIHGTGAISRLGTPASHGCVRLHPSHAATFYSLIRRYGMANTRIRISGTPHYVSYSRKKKSWKRRRTIRTRKYRYRQNINLTRRKSKKRRYRVVSRRKRRPETPLIFYGLFD